MVECCIKFLIFRYQVLENAIELRSNAQNNLGVAMESPYLT